MAEQLKQFTPGGSTSASKARRAPSAYKQRQPRTLLQQYEHLDPLTKQAFNETFLVNLESVKHSMGKLMAQHVDPQESRSAINAIFPPQQYLGTGAKVLDQARQDEAYNKEIEELLKKFTGGTHYRGFNNKEALEKRVGPQQDLRKGMAQAMRDIDEINKHLEQFIKAPQDAPQKKQQAFEVFEDDKDKSRVSAQD